MTARNPTDAEIVEAAKMIRMAREHAGIVVVSEMGSDSSLPPTSETAEVFSNERFVPGCEVTWEGVLDACFEWEPGVRGVELRDEEYQAISKVILA